MPSSPFPHNLIPIHTNAELVIQDAIYPPGRTASGFKQKMTALKKELKAEMDGGAVDTPSKKKAATATPKATGRKRKAAGAEGEEETPKKRGRGKKASPVATEEDEEDEAINVKGESAEEI